MFIVTLAAAASSLSTCAPQTAPAAPVHSPAPAAAQWSPVDAATGRIADLPGLQVLARQFPDSASVHRRLLGAAFRANDAKLAGATLSRLGAMGYALREESIDSLASLIGAAAATAAKARAAALRQEVWASVPFPTLAMEHRLIEGVALDSKAHRVFLSSVVDRRLVVMDDNRGIAIEGVDGGSLSGMAIDQPRRLLWVASGVIEQTPNPETAFRGLIAVDLDRLKPVRRVPAPAGAEFPSDTTVGPDGSVYTSDPMGGGVYRLRPGSAEMETLVEPGTLRSPQGLALHPEGRRLYVSDYAYGLAMIDLGSGKVARLATAAPMMLDGIDGLYWFQGALIGIQNGTSPMRIVRIDLDPPGATATRLSIVESAHPEWGEPTVGQISGRDLIYVSDPQWDRFGPGGALKGAAPLRPNRIRVTPLCNNNEPPRR